MCAGGEGVFSFLPFLRSRDEEGIKGGGCWFEEGIQNASVFFPSIHKGWTEGGEVGSGGSLEFLYFLTQKLAANFQ